MLRLSLILSVCLLTLAFSGDALAQSVNLPIDHWAYAFLERLETKGLFRGIDLRSYPLTRGEIVDIITQINRVVENKPNSLTTSERQLFEQLKGEFCDDVGMQDVSVQQRYRERHLLRWNEKKNGAFVDAIFQQTLDLRAGDSFDPAKRISETTAGGVIRGFLDKGLHFYLDARNTLTRGSDITEENFDPSQGAPVVTSGSNVYTDQAEAYGSFALSRVGFEIGRNAVHWGPGWRGGLALSRNAPIFDMLKLKVRFDRFKFTFLHGFLGRLGGSRYLAAHRLELKISPRLYAAGTETVIYGNRDVEFMYLNPLMPYHVAEHYLGNLDNNSLGFDVVGFPVRNLKLYGELFIDDMTLTENLFKYFGNKFAFLIGSQWTEPFGLRDATLRFEYTRIEPFVYTHTDSINTYVNFDEILGHWLGPNSDCLSTAADYRFSRDIWSQVWWQVVRHGEGDVYSPHRKELGTRKKFLGESVETQHILGFEIVDQLRRDIFLTFRYSWIHTNNVGLNEGQTANDQHAVFSLMVNY